MRVRVGVMVGVRGMHEAEGERESQGSHDWVQGARGDGVAWRVKPALDASWAEAQGEAGWTVRVRVGVTVGVRGHGGCQGHAWG